MNDWHWLTDNEWPPVDELLQWQRDSEEPFLATWRSFHPAFNVAGLRWRRIGKESPTHLN